MALGAEIVDLFRGNLFDQSVEIAGICQISVVEKETDAFQMGILVQMVDSSRVERAGAAHDAVNLVAFIQQQFRQIRTVLTCNSGDESLFHSLCPFGIENRQRQSPTVFFRKCSGMAEP